MELSTPVLRAALLNENDCQKNPLFTRLHPDCFFQEDISKFVGGLVTAAIRNGVLRDNALPTKKAIERGGSSLAVHTILSTLTGFMARRDFLQSKHFLVDFCSIIKVAFNPHSALLSNPPGENEAFLSIALALPCVRFCLPEIFKEEVILVLNLSRRPEWQLTHRTQ